MVFEFREKNKGYNEPDTSERGIVMTTPSSVPTPPVPPTPAEPEVTPEVEKVAGRIVRTKSFLSRQLKTTVPAFAAGAVATVAVAAARARNRGSDEVADFDTVDDSTE